MLRRGYEAWGRGDGKAFEALLGDHVAPEFELRTVFADRVYRGVEGLLDLWADVLKTWEEYRYETEDIIQLGERVLVVGHVQGRGAASGVPIDGSVVMLWALEGTKAVHAKFFASKEEALEAVGCRSRRCRSRMPSLDRLSSGHQHLHHARWARRAPPRSARADRQHGWARGRVA